MLAAAAGLRVKKRAKVSSACGRTTQQVQQELTCPHPLPPPDASAQVLRLGGGCLIRLADFSSAHERALTLTPKESACSMTKPKPYAIYKRTAAGVWVPKFYGLDRFPASRSLRVAYGGGPAVARFAGTLTAKQTAVVGDAMTSLRRHKGGMLVLPCGMGKTVMAIHVACALGLKCLVVVHTQCLFDQWKSRISTFAPEAKVGKLQGKHVLAVGKCINNVTRLELLDTGLFDSSTKECNSELHPPTVAALKSFLRSKGIPFKSGCVRSDLCALVAKHDSSQGAEEGESLRALSRKKRTVLDRVVGGMPYDLSPDAAPLVDQLTDKGVHANTAAELAYMYDGREFNFVISMVQSLSTHAYPAKATSYGLTIVDEAHHICAQMLSRSMFAVSSEYVLGLSATPKRTDGLGYALPWFLGPVACSVKAVHPDATYAPVLYMPLDASEITHKYTGKLILPHMITRMVADDMRTHLIAKYTVDSLMNGRYVIVISERLDHLDRIEREITRMIHIDLNEGVVYTPGPEVNEYESAYASYSKDNGSSCCNDDMLNFASFVQEYSLGLSSGDATIHPVSNADIELVKELGAVRDGAVWRVPSGMPLHKFSNWLVDDEARAPLRWAYNAERCALLPVGQYRGGMKLRDDRSYALHRRAVLTTYQMCSEGLDVPRLDTLVFATPRSNIEQSVGRILRSHPDKAVPRVYDIVDNYSIFSKMYWKRLALYKRMGLRRVSVSDKDAMC